MRVKMLKTEQLPIDKRSAKNYPIDWVGEVDNDVAQKWIAKGSAERVAEDAAIPVELTETEKAVLKAVAQQALSQIGQESIDPNTGEVGPPRSVAEVLADLTSAELKDFAKTKGVKVTARKRAAIEADLVKLIEAERAAAAA